MFKHAVLKCVVCRTLVDDFFAERIKQQHVHCEVLELIPHWQAGMQDQVEQLVASSNLEVLLNLLFSDYLHFVGLTFPGGNRR